MADVEAQFKAALNVIESLPKDGKLFLLVKVFLLLVTGISLLFAIDIWVNSAITKTIE